jgi:hypothetical protein
MVMQSTISDVRLHITRRMDPSEGLKPLKDRGVLSPGSEGGVDLAEGACFGNGGALRRQVDRRVAIRCLDAGVSEPVADCHEVDSSLEKMNGARVTQHVRVDTLGSEGCSSGARVPGLLAQDVPDTEAGERLAAVVAEQGLGGGRIDSAFGNQCSESVSRLRPKRTHALLTSFAVEQDMKRALKLDVARTQVDDLLDASAGVEEYEDERVVATTVATTPVGGIEERTHLVGFEILDEALSCPFEGHGEDPLAKLEVLGLACGCVPRKCVDCGEASVACRSAVPPIGLEMVEERENDVGGEVGEVEIHDGPLSVGSNESQDENEGIAIAANGVRAQAADPGEVIGEEPS